MTVKELDLWYFSCDFKIMERITNTHCYCYIDDDGYQEFVDICDNYWKNLKKYKKWEYYKKFVC